VPPNQTGRHRERRMDGSSIMDFFEELERRGLERGPLDRFEYLMQRYGPDLMFRMMVDTLHEMGDLDMILDIAEPMAAEHYQQEWFRESKHQIRGRRGDPFVSDDDFRRMDYVRHGLTLGDIELTGTYIGGADFNEAELRAFMSMAPDNNDPDFMEALRRAEAHIDAKDFFSQKPVTDFRDSDLHRRSERKKRRVR